MGWLLPLLSSRLWLGLLSWLQSYWKSNLFDLDLSNCFLKIFSSSVSVLHFQAQEKNQTGFFNNGSGSPMRSEPHCSHYWGGEEICYKPCSTDSCTAERLKEVLPSAQSNKWLRESYRGSFQALDPVTVYQVSRAVLASGHARNLQLHSELGGNSCFHWKTGIFHFLLCSEEWISTEVNQVWWLKSLSNSREEIAKLLRESTSNLPKGGAPEQKA